MANEASNRTSGAEATRFELTSFLDGRTVAWGVFEDRFGRIRRRFTVEMNGHWRDGVFLLDESFTYDDGSAETRAWRVTPAENGRFTATCDDCVGTAEGACDADTIRMTYRLRLQLQSSALVVDFDDRIYSVGDGVAVNRATMSKWGVRLGEVSLFFQRSANRAGADAAIRRAAVA